MVADIKMKMDIIVCIQEMAYMPTNIKSKHVKRKLSLKEKVHHIDLNKSNNNIKNLYLCNSYREHSLCHVSLQMATIQFLNKEIWFDDKKNEYSFKKNNFKKANIKNNEEIQHVFSLRTYLEQRKDYGSKYKRTTVGKKLIHVMIAELIIGRKLLKNEVVHHIDCNSLNNLPLNLKVMTRKEHSKCHKSIEDCGKILFQNKKIKFKNGKYYV
jgi:hypothetical protein